MGEVIAAAENDLVLAPASTKGYDATRPTGTDQELKVEIKATQGNSVAFRHQSPTCDEVIVLRLDFSTGSWQTIYNGPAQPAWDALPERMQKNGQRRITPTKLAKLQLSK